MRENIATETANHIRNHIADGELPAGSRINEVELAARLEVSRTPLREALARLAAEGFVANRPRRGYFVQELRIADVEQIYGVRAVLDPAALELAGLPDGRQLDRLDALNGEIGRSKDVERVIELHDRWHLALLDHCPNRVLLDLIEQFMRRTRPLARAYARSTANVATMVAEHMRIVGALRRGDLARGVATLKRNMQSGIGPIREWLERAPPTHEQMRKR